MQTDQKREALILICSLCKRLNPQHTGNPDTCECKDTAFLRTIKDTDQEIMEKVQAIRDKKDCMVHVKHDIYAYGSDDAHISYEHYYYYDEKMDDDDMLPNFATREALIAHMDGRLNNLRPKD